MNSKLRRRVLAIAPLLLVFIAGCGGASKGDMTGTITYKGKPICVGTVIVTGSDGLSVSGNIEESGTYTVTGVASGEVRIGVMSPEPPKEGGGGSGIVTEGRGKKKAVASVSASAAKKWFLIPDTLSNPEGSGLKATIKGGANTHNIVIE